MDTLAKREEAYTCMLQVKFDFRLKFFNQGWFSVSVSFLSPGPKRQPELDINQGKVKTN